MWEAGNKSYIDINQSVENEQHVSPATQDLYTLHHLALRYDLSHVY